MGNRDKRGREKKKPKKQGTQTRQPGSPAIAIRRITPPAQEPANAGPKENV
jgi:hypothetical protein